jgi:hypothetical protein
MYKANCKISNLPIGRLFPNLSRQMRGSKKKTLKPSCLHRSRPIDDSKHLVIRNAFYAMTLGEGRLLLRRSDDTRGARLLRME